MPKQGSLGHNEVTRSGIKAWVGNSRHGKYNVVRTQDSSAAPKTVVVDIEIPFSESMPKRGLRIHWKAEASTKLPERPAVYYCVVRAYDIAADSNDSNESRDIAISHVMRDHKIYETGHSRRYWTVNATPIVPGSKVLAARARLDVYLFDETSLPGISQSNFSPQVLDGGMRTVVSFEFVFSATHLQIQKQRTAADVTDFESQVSPTKTITVRPPKRNLRALEYEDDPGLEYVPSDGEDFPESPSKKSKANTVREARGSQWKNKGSSSGAVPGPAKIVRIRAPSGNNLRQPQGVQPVFDAVNALQRLEEMEKEEKIYAAELNQILQVKSATIESMKEAVARHGGHLCS
ncbi:hypothetical protein BJ165DRAFT_1615014 [Panaeolus papilionaceus]|nr:hypothetical protein BJ165DRAFT_1615014 [Panaeolus papilionaceus]